VVSQTGTADDLFIAGSHVNGSVFITHWDGKSLANANPNNTLLPGSTINDLSMLALRTSHQSNDLVQNELVLAVSGNLSLVNFGYASSALFDGSNWHPLLQTNTLDGHPGSIVGTFSSESRPIPSASSTTAMQASAGQLSFAVVIVVSLAIALVVLFFIVLAAEVLSIWRKRQKYALLLARTHEETKISQRSGGLFQKINETYVGLSHHVHRGQAALSTSRFGSGSYGKGRNLENTAFHSYKCAVIRDFAAHEAGEVDLRTGDHVIVLDDSDPVWWSGIVLAPEMSGNSTSSMRKRGNAKVSGVSRRGMFPAAFLAPHST